MKELSSNIITEKNKLATKNAWLILLEITLNDDSSTVFRLVRNFEDITFDGNTYSAFPFTLESVKHQSKGSIPTLSLQVSNVSRLLQPYIEDLNGGVGSVVKITIVNSGYLSLAADVSAYKADLQQTFSILSVKVTSATVNFTLGASNPLNKRFPLYKCIAEHCRWQFESVECGYTPMNIADITIEDGSEVVVEVTGHNFVNGEDVTFSGVGGTTELNGNTYECYVVSDDLIALSNTDGSDYTAFTSGGTVGYSACFRTIASCFDRGQEERFGGFMGMKSGGIRIA